MAMDPVEMPKEAQNILNIFLEEQGITDYSVNTALGTLPGENFVGFIHRITVNGKNQKNCNVKFVIIAKTAPNNETVRSIFPIRSTYEREVYCYTNLIPELVKLQDEQNICNPVLLFARFYKASLEIPNETLLLEDMTNLGYTKLGVLETLDVNHAFYVIKQYGRLHALSFALKLLKPDVFENLKMNTHDKIFQVLHLTEARQASYKMKSDLVLSCIDKEKDKHAYDLFVKFSGNMLGLVKKSVNAESAGDYGILTHGDSWISNYLFKYTESNKIDSMCMIDWQLSRYGSPALDLSQFLFCCTNHDCRKEHYTDLIKEYYRSFTSLLAEFKIDAQEVFPFYVLEEHLKKFSVFGLFMTIWILPLIYIQGKDKPSMQNSKTEKDIYKMPYYDEVQNNEMFKSRMGSIVTDFAHLGYEIDL